MKSIYEFKTMNRYFWKERDGVKNNTTRIIELDEDRYLDLITWANMGFNDGDIKIKIVNARNPNQCFIRDIRDIAIWGNIMIITWNHKEE